MGTQSADMSVRPKVLITRAEPHASELIKQLSEWGVESFHRQLIRISGFDDDASPASNHIRQTFLNIDEYQTVIAISQNAAEFGLNWLQDYWPQYPVGINWYAVGPTTALSLEEAGLSVQSPQEDFSSEGLLTLPTLQEEHIKDTKVLIWRGVGGRETLAEVLRQRGAKVDYAELYQREQIAYQSSDWESALESKPLLLLSSGQALDIAEQQVEDLLHRVSGILVPSQRVAEKAKAKGYQEVILAASALNKDTLEALHHWLNAGRIAAD